MICELQTCKVFWLDFAQLCHFRKIQCMLVLLHMHMFDGRRSHSRSGNIVAFVHEGRRNQLQIKAPCGCFNKCGKHHCAERPVLSSLSLDFLSLKVFSEWLCLLSRGACPRLSIHDFCQKHKTHHFFCAWIFLLLFFPFEMIHTACVYISVYST